VKLFLPATVLQAGEAVKVLSSAVPVVGGLANFSAAALRVGHRHVQTRRVVEVSLPFCAVTSLSLLDTTSSV